MPRNPERGFTMMELIVYSVLALLMLGLVAALFVQSRRNFEATSSSYLIARDAETAISWLQAELQETALTSVRVFPNADNPSEAPGVAFLSARDDEGAFQTNGYGAPKWSRSVFYTLKDDSVVRWEKELSDPEPIPSPPTELPSALGSSTTQRTVLRGVAKPNEEIPGLGTLDSYGGFKVLFVRQDGDGEVTTKHSGESLTAFNPSLVTLGKAGSLTNKGNTRMLELTLTMRLENSATGKKSVAELPFHVTPRH